MFQSFQTLSPEAKEQISRMADIWLKHLGEALTGIYLHGSLALESFAEGSSDVDILILGRVLSYKAQKRILSKYDSAMWTKEAVPERLRYIIDNAVQNWFFGGEAVQYKQEDLNELKRFLINEIKQEV
ncbi:MAG: DUF4111 domain-containing protein [Oscillospiraceae bacterium]|nr:DUF4111 domain-containing protein [Oscillospiraceae bacterium]